MKSFSGCYGSGKCFGTFQQHLLKYITEHYSERGMIDSRFIPGLTHRGDSTSEFNLKFLLLEKESGRLLIQPKRLTVTELVVIGCTNMLNRAAFPAHAYQCTID